MSKLFAETTALFSAARECIDNPTFAILETVSAEIESDEAMFRKFGDVVHVSSDALCAAALDIDDQNNPQTETANTTAQASSSSPCSPLRQARRLSARLHSFTVHPTHLDSSASSSPTSVVDRTLSVDSSSHDSSSELQEGEQAPTCETELTATTSKNIEGALLAQKEEFESRIKTTLKLHNITNPYRVSSKGAKKNRKVKTAKVLKLITDKAKLAKAAHNRKKTIFKRGHEYAVEVGYDVIMMLINPATGKLESYFSNPKYRGKLDNYDTLSELLNVDVAPPAAPAPSPAARKANVSTPVAIRKANVGQKSSAQDETDDDINKSVSLEEAQTTLKAATLALEAAIRLQTAASVVEVATRDEVTPRELRKNKQNKK